VPFMTQQRWPRDVLFLVFEEDFRLFPPTLEEEGRADIQPVGGEPPADANLADQVVGRMTDRAGGTVGSGAFIRCPPGARWTLAVPPGTMECRLRRRQQRTFRKAWPCQAASFGPPGALPGFHRPPAPAPTARCRVAGLKAGVRGRPFEPGVIGRLLARMGSQEARGESG
jgi:hypothetical protein